jgi:tetratricopeptide (TPR) repeat protein
VGNQQINAEKIGTPFQLLAAGMVFIVLLDGSFLSAAAVLEHPAWVPAALTIAAIVYPLVFFVGLFVLQTKFREQLLDDSHWLKRVREVSFELGQAVTATNLDFTRLNPGTVAPHLPAEQQSELEAREQELERILKSAADENIELHGSALADAARELAHAALARGKWLEAAERLETYLELNPGDWSEWFAQGTAYANTRGGTETDEASLASYDRTLDTIPSDVDPVLLARLYSYRAGVLKRLGRFEEARSELEQARELAVEGSYEADDINYNSAVIYAIEGKKENAVQALRQIREASYLGAVVAHREDYFEQLTGYGPFEELIENWPPKPAED